MRKRNKVIFFVYLLVVQLMSFLCAVGVGRSSRFSKFFHEDEQKEIFIKLEEESEAEARAYLKRKASSAPLWPVNVSSSSSSNSHASSPFCITIVTKERPTANYIMRSAAYLLSRLEQAQNLYDENAEKASQPLKVYITNAERPATSHMILSNLGSFVDIVHLQDLGSAAAPSIQLNSEQDWLRGEVFDTALIFSHAKGLGCSHLLALEDDGIVSRNFYEEVTQALRQLEEKGEEYFALKLFYSDTFSGWSKDLDDLLLLLMTTLVITLLVFLPCWVNAIPKIFKQYFKKLNKTVKSVKSITSVKSLCNFSSFWDGNPFNVKLNPSGAAASRDKVSVNVVGIFLLLYIWVFYIFLFHAVGKQSIFREFQERGLRRMGRHSGSTVGVVYQERDFVRLSDFLREKSEVMGRTEGSVVEWRGVGLKSVDLMMDDYVDGVLDLDTYLLLPNCVQHIGRYSSNEARNKGRLKALSTSNSFPKGDEQF